MNAVMIQEANVDLVESYRARFAKLSIEETYAVIRDALRMTVESWLTVAFGIQSLEERGEDAQKLRAIVNGGMLNWLRRIASGQLRPEMICRFYRRENLIWVIGRLPIPDQLKLSRGERISIVVLDEGGKRTVRQAAPDEMSEKQIKQVFARDRIRTETEQNLWLDQEKMDAAKPRPEQIGNFSIDHERQVAIYCGKKGDVIDLSTLAAVVATLRKQSAIQD